MKELINKARATLEASDNAFETWEADIENETLETAFDNAYIAYHAAARELAEVITTLAGIDSGTAYKMAIHKLDELELLAERIA